MTALSRMTARLSAWRVAVLFGQLQPGREQRLGPGFLQAREIYVFEHPPAPEVAGPQVVRHLPEERPSRVVTRHRSSPELSPFCGSCRIERVRYDQPAADVHARAGLGVPAVAPESDLQARLERQPALG